MDITGVFAEELNDRKGKEIWYLFKTLTMEYTISRYSEKMIDKDISRNELNVLFTDKEESNESSLSTTCTF